MSKPVVQGLYWSLLDGGDRVDGGTRGAEGEPVLLAHEISNSICGSVFLDGCSGSAEKSGDAFGRKAAYGDESPSQVRRVEYVGEGDCLFTSMYHGSAVYCASAVVFDRSSAVCEFERFRSWECCVVGIV